MAASATSRPGATSTDDQLRALVARGFRFVDPRDEHGDVVAVVGVRAHHDVVDVVQLNDEDDVVASRMPADQDVMAPRRVFWQETGPAHEVLAKLLDLPDDRLGGIVLAHGRIA
ncbi:hypothetical protein [Actinophytocola gossypii]|uniref:Uncharacterized protein n=1 Tax=Actinophytocola gossypii TaxID=2812003 RepID=A0ABT2JJN5_9PSEU|nr:hypothetical protein [Actinophytocola gossypii]MCT2588081.1 hypothetical protein [Actinophytocola gossypii]